MSVDAAYSAWVDYVHSLGGVATVWPFGGAVIGGYDPKTGLPTYTQQQSPYYGQPAARFPADVFATLANAGTLPMANGVQFNIPGTWVYVLASVMTGDQSVGQSLDAATQATQAEVEQACAVNGNCPTDLEQTIKTVVIGAAVVAGAVVAVKVLNAVS